MSANDRCLDCKKIIAADEPRSRVRFRLTVPNGALISDEYEEREATLCKPCAKKFQALQRGVPVSMGTRVRGS